jgi:hypothetical protein
VVVASPARSGISPAPRGISRKPTSLMRRSWRSSPSGCGPRRGRCRTRRRSCSMPC